MKEGFAVLPLEVWADVSEHPLITRQVLAQIADNNGDPAFTNKLQKLLHGYGKHSLRFLDISAKKPNKTKQEPIIPVECRAILTVSPNFNSHLSHSRGGLSTSKECEFPDTDMPENIKHFKLLAIRYFDDQVFTFLDQVKPLFTNVFLKIVADEQKRDVRIFLTHFLLMVGSIRGIACNQTGLEILERHFAGALALSRELHLPYAKLTSIPTCLNWLCAPLDFDEHGPRFLRACADSETISAIINAVRKQFLSAITSAAFVIFLEFNIADGHKRADELTFESAATKEELTVRNASFKKPNGEIIHYAEVLRNQIGADAIMREWIEKRAYYEKKFCGYNKGNREIRIWDPTIGRINKQAENDLAKVRDNNNANGPSTSAKENE